MLIKNKKKKNRLIFLNNGLNILFIYGVSRGFMREVCVSGFYDALRLLWRKVMIVRCAYLQVATLGHSPSLERFSDMPDSPPLSKHETHDDTLLSPTSEVSSGYFSTSVSMATLSEVYSTGGEPGACPGAASIATTPSIDSEDTTVRSLNSTAVVDGGKDGFRGTSEKGKGHQRAVTPMEVTAADRNGLVSPQPDTKPVLPTASPLPALLSADGSMRASGSHKAKMTASPDVKPLKRFMDEVEKAAWPETGQSGSLEKLEITSDSDEALDTTLPNWLKGGARVTLGGGKCGTVRYVGTTDFADGIWVGVELDSPSGTFWFLYYIFIYNLQFSSFPNILLRSVGAYNFLIIYFFFYLNCVGMVKSTPPYMWSHLKPLIVLLNEQKELIDWLVQYERFEQKHNVLYRGQWWIAGSHEDIRLVLKIVVIYQTSSPA